MDSTASSNLHDSNTSPENQCGRTRNSPVAVVETSTLEPTTTNEQANANPNVQSSAKKPPRGKLGSLTSKVLGEYDEQSEVTERLRIRVFFTVVCASGNIWNVINTGPSIFMSALVQIAIHLALIWGLGKLFRFDLKLLLIASNANVRGPATACGMATAKGWSSMVVLAFLVFLRAFLALPSPHFLALPWSNSFEIHVKPSIP